MVSSSSHRRFADDAVLFNFRLPQLHSDTTMTSASTLLPLAAPVLFSLHLLGQSLKVDVTRCNELPLLLRAVLRLSSQIAPEWTDYWSRICPDLDEVWRGLEQGKTIGTVRPRGDNVCQVTTPGIFCQWLHQTSLITAYRAVPGSVL